MEDCTLSIDDFRGVLVFLLKGRVKQSVVDEIVESARRHGDERYEEGHDTGWDEALQSEQGYD